LDNKTYSSNRDDLWHRKESHGLKQYLSDGELVDTYSMLITHPVHTFSLSVGTIQHTTVRNIPVSVTEFSCAPVANLTHIAVFLEAKMEAGRQEAIYLHHACTPLNCCCVVGTLGAAAVEENDVVKVVEGGADCVGEVVVVEEAAGMVLPSPEVVVAVAVKARHPDGVLQLHIYLF